MYSRLWLNQFLKEIEKWDFQELQRRYGLLLNRFFEIWEYPDVMPIAEDEIEQEYTINSAPDPTGKKLQYFIFKDEKIVEKEISKMYYHVIRNLFQEKPTLFLNSELKHTLQITANPMDLRMRYPISETYFIEANIGNNEKFRRLRYALTKCDCEDELLISYSKSTSTPQ